MFITRWDQKLRHMSHMISDVQKQPHSEFESPAMKICPKSVFRWFQGLVGVVDNKQLRSVNGLLFSQPDMLFNKQPGSQELLTSETSSLRAFFPTYVLTAWLNQFIDFATETETDARFRNLQIPCQSCGVMQSTLKCNQLLGDQTTYRPRKKQKELGDKPSSLEVAKNNTIFGKLNKCIYGFLEVQKVVFFLSG